MGVKGVGEFVVWFVLVPRSLWFFFCKPVVHFLCSALRFSCALFVLAPWSLWFGLWSTSCAFFVLRFAIQLCVFLCLPLEFVVFFSANQLCTFCAFFCALKRISEHEQKHKRRTTEIYYGSRKFPQQHPGGPGPCLQPSSRGPSGLAGLPGCHIEQYNKRESMNHTNHTARADGSMHKLARGKCLNLSSGTYDIVSLAASRNSISISISINYIHKC